MSTQYFVRGWVRGVFLVWLAAAPLFAVWAKMSLRELVEASDLIVIGEVGAIRSSQEGPMDVGTLQVREVLLGKKGTKEVSLGVREKLVHSGSIVYKPGQSGLWFLRRKPGSEEPIYLADHPQRRQAEGEAAAVRQYLLSRKK